MQELKREDYTKERLPQVSRLRHFVVCTKNTENIFEKEREKGIMSEKV